MSDWIRRPFGGIGVTQSPPGRSLSVRQDRYVGKVILCIDVSPSMMDYEAGRTRLQHAIAGAHRFVDGAIEAGYRVGLILWDSGVRRLVPVAAEADPVLQALRSATFGDGTNVRPALELGIRELRGLTGDRVLAIFGDGDIGPVGPAIAASRVAASQGLRIIVRGLGEHATAALRQIATETDDDAGREMVARAAGIEAGISSMVASITRRVIS